MGTAVVAYSDGYIFPQRRTRLLRQSSPAEQFGLAPGATYRIAYSVGGLSQRRVTRSVVMYHGESQRRRWDGEATTCLDFVLPQGRALSLIAHQLIDARPTTLNEHGQWVLNNQMGARRRRASRRRHPAA